MLNLSNQQLPFYQHPTLLLFVYWQICHFSIVQQKCPGRFQLDRCFLHFAAELYHLCTWILSPQPRKIMHWTVTVRGVKCEAEAPKHWAKAAPVAWLSICWTALVSPLHLYLNQIWSKCNILLDILSVSVCLIQCHRTDFIPFWSTFMFSLLTCEN